MFLITSLKKSKLWVKILIFLMLTAFILKIDPNLNNILYYYRLILTNKLITLKLILIFISMFYILYFILILYLINKYSILKVKPVYSNYIPLFLKNTLNELYEVSQLHKELKQIVIDSTIKTLFAVTFLIMITLLILIITSHYFNN